MTYPHCEIVSRTSTCVVYWDRTDPTDPIYRQVDPRRGDYELLRRQVVAQGIASRVGTMQGPTREVLEQSVAEEIRNHGEDSKEARFAARRMERLCPN